MRQFLWAVIAVAMCGGCATQNSEPRCDRPAADILEVRKNIVNMVVVVGYVRNANESWFTCAVRGEGTPVESNHERREGTVIGEFANLPPDTDYVLTMFAKNACGITEVLATKRFRTPHSLRHNSN